MSINANSLQLNVTWLVVPRPMVGREGEGGLQEHTTVLPAHRKRRQKGMEHGVWELPPLYSFLQKDRAQRGRGE